MTEDDHTSAFAEAPAASTSPKPGLPTRIDLRRAFDVYVYGRNRTLGPDQKGAAVSGKAVGETAPASASDPVEDPAAPGVIVPVPTELRFDRNAGTWRDSLARPDRGAK